MTDKIIIDGVDVTNCNQRIECLNDNNDVQCMMNKIYTEDYIITSICKDNPNCLYKQLQREKQKVKKSKEDLKNSFEEKKPKYYH